MSAVSRKILWLFLFFLAANLSYALDVKLYQADFNIFDNKAVAEIGIIFNEKTSEQMKFELPEDYAGLSVYVDEKPVQLIVEDNILKIDLNSNIAIRFNYVTKEFVDKSNFLMNLKLDFDVDNLIIKLTLPEGATLKKSIEEGDLTTGSIYPKPARATTDGRSIIFYWEKTDMKEGDEISIFAQIEPERNYLWLVSLLIIITLIALFLLAYSSRRLKKKIKHKVVLVKQPGKIIVQKEDIVERHVKEDEEQIINILKAREGSCEQGTLRVITGMPKATLSRIIKELEDRKFIYKEKRGKKNLIFLRK